MSPPKWIKPQLCKLAAKAPSGPLWVHEIKFDGYRIAARIDQGAVQLLTRSGLDWTAKYPATAAALATLKVKSAYLDGELCGVRPDGVTSFELMQQASDRGGAGLVYFVFDLLDLDGEDLAALPLLDSKTRLAALFEKPPDGIAFSAHETCDGEAFRRAACRHGLEGVSPSASIAAISPTTAAPGSNPNVSIAANSSSSAGRTRKGRGPSWAPCCSPVTMTMAGCSTPAASEPACRRRRSPSSTAASRHSPSRKRRSTFRRRAKPASAAGSSSRKCIGSARSWSP